MADNSLHTDSPLRWVTGDLPKTSRPGPPPPRGTLTDYQRSKLYSLQEQKRSADQKYLRAHPELRAITSMILSAILIHEPQGPILEFCAEFFDRPRRRIDQDLKPFLEKEIGDVKELFKHKGAESFRSGSRTEDNDVEPEAVAEEEEKSDSKISSDDNYTLVPPPTPEKEPPHTNHIITAYKSSSVSRMLWVLSEIARMEGDQHFSHSSLLHEIETKICDYSYGSYSCDGTQTSGNAGVEKGLFTWHEPWKTDAARRYSEMTAAHKDGQDYCVPFKAFYEKVLPPASRTAVAKRNRCDL